MSKDKFHFQMRPDVNPQNLFLSHLLRIEEKLTRQEFILHRILSMNLEEDELRSFIEFVDGEAEKMKFELLADIVKKYG